MSNTDEFAAYMNYIKKGRGRAEGGLVAACHDNAVLVEMVARAKPLISIAGKVISGMVDGHENENATTAEYLEKVEKWLSDFGLMVGEEGVKS